MQIGYARESTQDQDLRLQYEALRQVPCDKIYEDKASGAKASREGLRLVLDILRGKRHLGRVETRPVGP